MGEQFLEMIGLGKSVGPAQITVETAISEGLFNELKDNFQTSIIFLDNGIPMKYSADELFRSHVRTRLLSPQGNIDAAGKLLRNYLGYLCDAYSSGNISTAFRNKIMGGERLTDNTFFCYRAGNY
jgi:hypothetical protein